MDAILNNHEFTFGDDEFEYKKDRIFELLVTTFEGITSKFWHKKLIGTSKIDVFYGERRLIVTLIDDKKPIDTPIEHHLYIKVDDLITFTFQKTINGVVEESNYSYPVTIPRMDFGKVMKMVYTDFSDNFSESQKIRLKSLK